MPLRIEDYALIGDRRTAALVGRDGSIDWLCVPRFDSGACFAALLGTPENGRWQIAPRCAVVKTSRRYRDGSLVLETDFETGEGAVRLVDAMPLGTGRPTLVRLVQGLRGTVPMRMQLVIRCDYGVTVPWVRRHERGIHAIAGPDKLHLVSAVPARGENLTTVAEFEVSAGETVPFELTSCAWNETPPAALDVAGAIEATDKAWRDWSGKCRYEGAYREAVVRSLITLEALTYAPTGGIVAAPTTSLPESLGGVRNWDYRYCWLRDATFTLFALMHAGYTDEARAWREWLLRAIAGKGSQLQVLYGVAGERRIVESEVAGLPGYEGAAPVRVGNGAAGQLQLDVYGEVIDVLYQCQVSGLNHSEDAWRIATQMLEFLEDAWDQPDEGIWEVRGPRRHFTYSKVMAWVAMDRAVKAIEKLGRTGPLDRWKALRDQIHSDVCQQGFDRGRNTFVQYFGTTELDASLLRIALVGFLPPNDPRVVGTVAAIERELLRDGFVLRYATESNVDGLPPGEGVFLPCTFWLADNYALQGREAEATALFESMLAIRNDLGLLAEEYDTGAKRLVGNFPQAFSHVALVNSAVSLTHRDKPADQRGRT